MLMMSNIYECLKNCIVKYAQSLKAGLFTALPSRTFQTSEALHYKPQVKYSKWDKWIPPSNKRFYSTTVETDETALQNIIQLILQKKIETVVVMAGAGISTPSGLPDFRTPGTGLYDNLQKYDIPTATAIFDIDYFHIDPRPFFELTKELYPGKYKPNYVHYFVRLLNDKKLLLRMYTQNIDGLERIAGIPPNKLVEAHGTFTSATCTSCREPYLGEEVKKIIDAGEIPRCKIKSCQGVIKPDIVFFGEDLPKRFHLFMKDMPKSDFLIVLGTSLEVEPFASIGEIVGRNTPRLLINNELVGSFCEPRKNDVILIGDVVAGVKKLVKALNWNEELERLINENNNQ